MRTLTTQMLIFLMLVSMVPFTPAIAQTTEAPTFSRTVQFELNHMIGSDGLDWAHEVAVDNDGNLILATVTTYPIYNTGTSGPASFYSGPYYDRDPDFRTFPITENASQSSYRGRGDIVLTKFDQNGNMLFSTYYGGSGAEYIQDIEVNSKNEIIIVGRTRSDNLPLRNAVNTNSTGITKGYIAQFSPGGVLQMSTYWGGTYLDHINALIIDDQDNLIISGATKSQDYPEINPIFENIVVTNYTAAAFLTKLNSELEPEFSTLIGGSDIDGDFTIAELPSGDITVLGMTQSTNFPTSENAADQTHNGDADAFYTRVTATGELQVSTFVGGSSMDWISSSAVDGDGNVVITGFSNSKNYPTDEGEDTVLNNGFGRSSDAILTKIGTDGQIIWSTYLGGSNADKGEKVLIDSEQNIIIFGETTSSDFPIFGIEDKSVAINQGMTFENGVPPVDIFVSKFVPSGKLGWSVVFGSKGMDNFGDADFIFDNSVFFSGYTIGKESYPSTNNFEPAALDDAVYGILSIPNVDLPEDFEGYQAYIVEQSTDQSFLDTYTDDIGKLVIYGIGALVLLNIVAKTRIWERFTKRENEEWKDDIKAYHQTLSKMDDSKQDK